MTIVITGTGGVGKSALTLAYVSHHFVSEYDPTIEDSHRKQVLVDGVVSVLDILDTAGQEEFRSMQDQWFRTGQGFVLVYSIADRKSLEHLSELRAKILRIQDSDSVPMVLVGNKSDLPDDQREVSLAIGKDQASAFSCPFFESSAKLRTNVDELFAELVRQVRKKSGTSIGGKKKVGKKSCLLY